jgi:hypothetical protein
LTDQLSHRLAKPKVEELQIGRHEIPCHGCHGVTAFRDGGATETR